MKAILSSYLYNGAHRHWDRRTRTFDPALIHYDWRYKITVDGETIYYRAGFCSWDAAAASLHRSWSKLERAIGQRETPQ